MNIDIDAELQGLLEGATDAEALIAEELLAELDAGSTETIVIEEPEVAETVDVVAELSDKELGIDKSELYEAQESKVGVAADEDAAPVEGKTTVSRKGRSTTSATPGADPTATTRSGLLKKKADVSGLSTLGYSDDEIDEIMTAIDEAPKKVGEKASNLLRYGLGREHVSNFTKFALNKLRTADDMSITVPELVKAMTEERTYSIGTARSQSQQMSRLFGIFGMISKDGSKMTLDPDHRLTKAILGRLDGEPGWAKTPDLHADDASDEEQVPGGVETLSEEVPQEEVEAASPPPTIAEQAKGRRKKKGAQAPQEALAA